MRERLLKQTERHVYATGIHLIFARATETAPTNAASAVIALARLTSCLVLRPVLSVASNKPPAVSKAKGIPHRRPVSLNE